MYGIYNKINHKIYIGSTTKPVVRFYEHLVSGDNSNLHLQNSIKKEGLESFSVFIFEVISNSPYITNKDMLKVEQKYLDYFPSEQKYNFARIAGGGGRIMTIEERKSISVRMKGVNVGRAPVNKGGYYDWGC